MMNTKWRVCSHQSFREQLGPVLGGELECLGLLAAAFAECEVELGSLTFSYRADAADVPIRPLVQRKVTAEREKHIVKSPTQAV